MVTSVAWNPDDRHVATGCIDYKIHYWDAEVAEEVMTPWEGHHEGGIVVEFNPTGDRLMSRDWGRLTRLWDVQTGRLLLHLSGETALRFGSNGLLCCHAGGRMLRLRKITDDQEFRILRCRNCDLSEWLAVPIVHRDGRLLAVTTPRRLSFFDLETGEELAWAGLSSTRIRSGLQVGIHRAVC